MGKAHNEAFGVPEKEQEEGVMSEAPEDMTNGIGTELYPTL
jgi:hypothetical protein